MNSLIEWVGHGVINLIFFDFEEDGEFELVAWKRTNVAAYTWIQMKINDIIKNSLWDKWPNKIVSVFVVIQDEDTISVRQVIKYEKSFSGYSNEVEDRGEYGERVAEYVNKKWITYKELNGIL